MTNSLIPINIPLTDSFSLKLKFDDCQVLDERLTSNTHIYYESLNAYDSELYPPKPILISENGISIRIGLANINIWDNVTQTHTPTKFINLTVSSKLLRENYFNGINKNNIKDLYEQFLSFEIFFCEYDIFLNGYISDIDICINRYSNSPICFQDSLEMLQQQTGTKQKFTHLINQASNIGLSFNKRENAKPSIPFIKLYHKEFELLSKSAEFYNCYLFPKFSHDIKNLTRIEATIKNYDHKVRLAKYGILKTNFKSLKEYFEITQKELYDFVIFSVNSYVEKKPRKNAPNLSPSDHLIYKGVEMAVMQGYDLKTIQSIFVTDFKGSSSEVTSVSQSRMRKKIKDLFICLGHIDVKIQSKIRHNSHVMDYLNFLKIDFN